MNDRTIMDRLRIARRSWLSRGNAGFQPPNTALLGYDEFTELRSDPVVLSVIGRPEGDIFIEGMRIFRVHAPSHFSVAWQDES